MECLECQCTLGQYSLIGRPMICWVLYQSAAQLYMFFSFLHVINALQEPTPKRTNLRRNVRNGSKLSEMFKKFDDSEIGDIYDKSRKDKLRHKIWVAKSPPELPAVSTDHETLCSFSPHAQPRWNLVDFECICAHGELLIHCNILTMTQTMNHTTSQLMNLYTVISWQWNKIWITQHHNWWNNG